MRLYRLRCDQPGCSPSALMHASLACHTPTVIGEGTGWKLAAMQAMLALHNRCSDDTMNWDGTAACCAATSNENRPRTPCRQEAPEDGISAFGRRRRRSDPQVAPGDSGFEADYGLKWLRSKRPFHGKTSS